jgi:hypothetical protein
MSLSKLLEIYLHTVQECGDEISEGIRLKYQFEHRLTRQLKYVQDYIVKSPI